MLSSFTSLVVGSIGGELAASEQERVMSWMQGQTQPHSWEGDHFSFSKENLGQALSVLLRFSTILDAGPKYCFFLSRALPGISLTWRHQTICADVKSYVNIHRQLVNVWTSWLSPLSIWTWISKIDMSGSTFYERLDNFLFCASLMLDVRLPFFLARPIYPIFVSLCRWL